MLRGPAGDSCDDAELQRHLGYDLDAQALDHIGRHVRSAVLVAEKLVATRARFNAAKTRANCRELQRMWVASQWNAPVVRIWSAGLSQFRKLYLQVRIDGSVWLVDEIGYQSTWSLMWDRDRAAKVYPFNTMTEEEAIAAQLAVGAKDNYAPIPLGVGA
jgi:hypothetical protein